MKITFNIPDDTIAIRLETWSGTDGDGWLFLSGDDEEDKLKDGAVYDLTED